MGKNVRVLIAVVGWERGARNGENQAMRDTCLGPVPSPKNSATSAAVTGRFNQRLGRPKPSVEYKFFIGDGTPTREDETAVFKSMGESPETYRVKADYWSKETTQSSYVPKGDEVFLHVPDDYIHHVYKTREAHRWAVEHGYDYIFKCDVDTYVDVQRLMNSGFENYDYIGKVGGNDECGYFASGGCGHWLSKKAAHLILDAPVTFWAEDGWIGSVMRKHGIEVHHDGRYVDAPDFPKQDNDIISAHLAITPTVYDSKRMYEIHRLRYL